MAESNDVGCARVTTSGNDRGLVRLRSTVREEALCQPSFRRQRSYFLCQSHLRLGGKNRRNVLHAIQLLVYSLGYPFIAMANADRNDAAEKIQVLPAVRIEHVLVFRTSDHQRLTEIVEDGGKEKLLLREQNFFFVHRSPSQNLRVHVSGQRSTTTFS